eukprot:Protomagalhaensia_wolfi_Nauph_80__1697@NODE_2052_length_1231_cov_11_619966_g1604_i0_p2_GENE_NODE_2052_length_1231_cov_11_619966_g1604_i0NODE_2052_length_1231_cov_11_619966_g1604_i0_p2_ORF_typecomplete_len101_score26_50Nuc_sug_transp/PF04142_15/5_8e06Nuc_sug_transp/PF04142_15/8e02CRTlike/PF08627_10/0_022DUF2670/PF10875_8/0_25EOS1/PF12326_8/3_3_NODE_2052_length_1231_cov_11_619966_g1604_i07921094
MSASLIRVVAQMKLLMTAAFAWMLMGTRQTMTQWLLISAVTILVVIYGLLDGGDFKGDIWGIGVSDRCLQKIENREYLLNDILVNISLMFSPSACYSSGF